ncbi:MULTISPECIES: ParB/RepB/Spo0J family partition protein [unclassified Streptomyces]|jgi:ParB-like chromosome segregation protein Spo0J|uniref:ParB/RepB/Spo0J family partition protein n=1 Tax=unclassified Streptomyces TaxID=2593676 RepID=UPI0036F8E183
MSFEDDLGPALASEFSEVEVVPISRLLPADSPRRQGENDEHARLLAGSEDPLPPILVHRPSMRVIDGMHRLLAARSRGSHTIDVRFFDGPEKDAFVLAVQANVRHGLPLSTADRTAAAVRILRTHQNWSDRVIASVTGLSAKSVAVQRLKIHGDATGPAARIGRDGRVRPLSSAEGRRTAARLLLEDPSASLRSIAKKAGISPGTVRDVRDRLRRGESPVPTGQRAAGRPPVWRSAPPVAPYDKPVGMSTETREATFRSLCRDPSLRMTETGRLLLRMMELHMAADHRRIAASVPAHCADSISEMATACAEEWQNLADALRMSAPTSFSAAFPWETVPAAP